VQHLLLSHRFLETRDCDEAHGVISQLWEQHEYTIVSQAYRMRWHHAPLQRSSLTYVAHPCALRVRCEGPLTDQFRICFQRTGTCDYRVNGTPATTRAGTALVHAPGQQLALETSTDQSLLMLGLDGDFVRRALARRLKRTPPLETWAAGLPAASPSLPLLRSLCNWVAAELDRPNSVLATMPRVVANLERTLRAAFVECLMELAPAPGGTGGDLNEAQVRLVEAWMDANIEEAIGVDGMADAIGVQPRAVVNAFRRLRGRSPQRALTERRLERARQRLLAADPGTTVTDVATSLGFFHFGRFAQRYRERFGERPSDTLAGRRRLTGLF
jgi:AraC-like DNA-binding protein